MKKIVLLPLLIVALFIGCSANTSRTSDTKMASSEGPADQGMRVARLDLSLIHI